VLLTIFAARYPDFGNLFIITNWFGTETPSDVTYGLAIGFTMLACFLGALVPFPIPYAIPVSTFAYLWFFNSPNPWLWMTILVATAALANTIGDSFDYIIGRGAEYFVSKDDPGQTNQWAQLILTKPRWIPFIVFLFALTPLPDSLLLVPLGIVKYSPKKALIAMYLGKFLMMWAYAWAGILTIDPLLALLGGEGSWVSGILLLFGVWLIMAIMLKVKPKTKSNPPKHE
jgi:membrane protein YqaA with SNARE-associated domain